MKKILLLGVLFLNLSVYAQYYSDGQDRAGIHWERIQSIHFEVIFPSGFETKAEQVVKMMEKSYQYTTVSLKQKPKPISIILHTETVKSNAFLGWAPSRIEMYTTPHQGIYSQDWLEQLAIHEYRHMVQISKLETEMPKLLRWLFGEQAAALLTAAYMPFWFIEGDAVSTETGLSNSGRGRFPDFHKELKAQFLEKGIYSYDKAYLGSYKNHVPNYYQMGYFLTAGARMKYGNNIWESVVHNVARKPWSLNPFNSELKKITGLKKSELYDSVFNGLKTRWENEDQLIPKTPFDTLSSKHKYYTNYNFAHKVNDSTYIAERSGIWDVNRIVEITSDGKEKIIFTPGYHFQASVSGKGDLIVWSERLSHPRWYHSDRSLLRIFNTSTRKLTEYKYSTKLFAPALSSDMKRIVAVEVDSMYQFHLVIINLNSGKIEKKIHTPENNFFITPSWSEDGRQILSVVMHNNQKAIATITIENANVEVILPFANQEIKNPIEYRGKIYFIGGYTGVDNLYCTTKNEKIVYEVISSRFGIAEPTFHENELVYSNYTANGYQLVKANMSVLKPKPVDMATIQKSYPIADAIAKQEKGVIDFSDLDNLNYQSEKYSKAGHLFKIHSWAPISIDPYRYKVYPGVSIMSQNMLSTTEFTAGYRYLTSDNEGEYYGNFNYYGFYPVINAELTHGKRKSSYYQITQYTNQNNEVYKVDTSRVNYGWLQTNLSVNSYIPFNFSKGRYYRKIQPRLSYNMGNVVSGFNAPDALKEGRYQYIETGLYLYQINNSSQQDVLPNFGVIANFSYLHSLPGIHDFGSMYSAIGQLYLPGFSQNHGISIYNGFQSKDRAEYAFSDRINYPRGHKHIMNDMMYSFAADYKLPLLYPDINIGRWAYLKRFKMDLFYDFCAFSGKTIDNNSVINYNGHLQSTGIELTTDMHILRFIAPIQLGVRSSYLFNQSFDFDFLLNIQFSF